MVNSGEERGKYRESQLSKYIHILIDAVYLHFDILAGIYQIAARAGGGSLEFLPYQGVGRSEQLESPHAVHSGNALDRYKRDDMQG